VEATPGIETGRRGRAWHAALLLLSVPLGVALAVALWRVPYAISETVAVLEDVQRQNVLSFFDLSHAYVRPVFYALLVGVWTAADSLATAVAWMKGLHVATALLVVGAFVALVRPRNALSLGAAAVAVTVLVGSPGFRDNLENLPLNQMLLVMLVALPTWALVERPRRWWHGLAFVAATALAIGLKEQGLLLGVAVVAAGLMRAPGVSRGAMVALTALVIAYLGLRILTPGTWEVFMQDVGLGFRRMPRQEALTRFGDWPYGVYLYSMTSTALRVLFAEPTDGVFGFMRQALDGEYQTWAVIEVLSSTALTIVIGWWGLRAWRERHSSEGATAWRLAVVTGLIVAGSGAFGFNFTRDRFGGLAAPFYALCAFHALRAAAERAAQGRRLLLWPAVVLLLALAGAWQVRAIGTVLYLRATAEKNQREWLIDVRLRRATFADREVYLSTIDALVEQGLRPLSGRGGRDPRWYRIFGSW